MAPKTAIACLQWFGNNKDLLMREFGWQKDHLRLAGSPYGLQLQGFWTTQEVQMKPISASKATIGNYISNRTTRCLWGKVPSTALGICIHLHIPWLRVNTAGLTQFPMLEKTFEVNSRPSEAALIKFWCPHPSIQPFPRHRALWVTRSPPQGMGSPAACRVWKNILNALDLPNTRWRNDIL